MRGFITAFRTLTIIPIPGKDADRFSDAIPWFPAVGAVLGFILAWIARVTFALTGWASFSTLLTLLFSVMLTGAIHLDGLADSMDGLIGAQTKEKALSIMKDHSVGVFGAVSLIFALSAKYIAIYKLIEIKYTALMVPAYINSRVVMSYLAVSLPYARKKEGTARPFVEGSSGVDFLKAIAVALALNGILFCLGGIFLLVSGMAIGGILGLFYLSRVGGVTGDLLGAASEIVEIVILFIGILLYIKAPEVFVWQLKL